MKAYVAGPFFTPFQLKSIEAVEGACKAAGLKMFRPRVDAGTLGKAPTLKDMKSVFTKDVKAIDKCDFVVADCTYKDTGTSFELGYAFAKGIPVVMFVSSHYSKRKVNLMLASSCFAVCTSMTQLEELLRLLNAQQVPRARKYAEQLKEKLFKGIAIE